MRVPVRCRPGQRIKIAGAIVLILAAPLTACGTHTDRAAGIPTVNLYNPPLQNLQPVIDDCNRAAAGRYRIVYRVLPRGADDQRVQLVRRLAADDPSLDVLGIDVTWTQEFASAGWVREWTGARRATVEAGTLAGPLESASYRGRLYAAPNNTNVQLLWYRADLVATPPTTWDEMIAMAQRLKAEGRTHRILTMGAQYEGLVVLFNTLVASAGGSILSADGRKPTVDAGAVRALELMRRFATAGVTSPSLGNMLEDNVRLDFQAGNGAFQLNWPFVYPAMQKAAPQLARQVRWARYPAVDAGTPARVTVGGTNLAVSATSRHPDLAFDAATCLRSAEHQQYAAIHGGVPPTIEAVYHAPGMDQAYPMRDTILDELRTAATRPRTPAYQNISTVVSAELSPMSAIRAPRVAGALRSQIRDALASRGVLP